MEKNNDFKEEQRLVELAQKDRENFAPLYEKYYPIVLGYIQKRLEKREISEDLSSRVFEKALNGIDNFQWQGVPFGSWLFRIARNVLNDYFRAQGRQAPSVSLDAVAYMVKDKDPQPDEQVILDEREVSLYSALAELDDEDQYLMYYKFFEGLSNVEIASITGLSETNVGTKLYRIRKKMKDYLGEIENQK